MNILLSQRAIEALAVAPLPVQKAFIKQLNFLCRNLQHPSLHAKKFDESQDRSKATSTASPAYSLTPSEQHGRRAGAWGQHKSAPAAAHWPPSRKSA
jgi:hypothetical protein